jgi:HTH-type transcriptional regulator/antitoxin HipB
VVLGKYGRNFPDRENFRSFGAERPCIFPIGKMNNARHLIESPKDLGMRIRDRRSELKLTQTELADVSGVTLRLVSELENGKESAQLAGVLRVLASLGLNCYLERR